MQLYIDGKEAALADSATFSYYEESRYFSDARGYSLNIELPLEGCAANRAIFGRIELHPPKSAKWPARIEAGKVIKDGVVILTDVSAAAVKVQFLSGRSTADYAKNLEETYVNNLKMADEVYVEHLETLNEDYTRCTYDDLASGTVSDVFAPVKTYSGNYMEIPSVALTWYNETEAVTHNRRVDSGPDKDGHYHTVFSKQTHYLGLSWMPYLLPLAKAITKACGYSFDFSAWEASDLRNLVVANAIPAIPTLHRITPASSAGEHRYRCRYALPRWTVPEFFDNIAPLLGGEFTFDHLLRRVDFAFSDAAMRGRVAVELQEVEDEYEITSSFGQEETEGNYIRTLPWRYDDPGMSYWKYMDCPWVEASMPEDLKVRYDSYTEMIAEMKAHKTDRNWHSRLYYAADVDCWFCYNNLTTITGDTIAEGMTVRTEMMPLAINAFGPKAYEKDRETEYRVLKVLPVVPWAGMMRLAPEGCEDPLAGYANGEDSDPVVDAEKIVKDKKYADILKEVDREEYQTEIIDKIDNGEPEKDTAYYDHLFVGYWDGGTDALLSYPYSLGFRYDWEGSHPEETRPNLPGRRRFSMRLSGKMGVEPYAGLPKIDESIMYTFHFHADKMPDVNAVFYIHGHRYLCKRIEVTLSGRGMSRRMKGEFYPVVEEE